jgi:hypothetical protein
VTPNPSEAEKRRREKNGYARINTSNGNPNIPSSYTILPVRESTLGFVGIELNPSTLSNLLASIDCHELNPCGIKKSTTEPKTVSRVKKDNPFAKKIIDMHLENIKLDLLKIPNLLTGALRSREERRRRLCPVYRRERRPIDR